MNVCKNHPYDGVRIRVGVRVGVRVRFRVSSGVPWMFARTAPCIRSIISVRVRV